MDSSVFSYMQAAVDIVGTSAHPTNKIAATIAGVDDLGVNFAISSVNYSPACIRDKIGTNISIGGSSGTVHAETACLLDAPKKKYKTGSAALFVTDPPCPNCVKNMAEAGIAKLYIDHKGFDKDFAARRGEDVRDMSLRMCEKAGISVYKIFRKEQRVEALVEATAGYAPPMERPAYVEKMDRAVTERTLKDIIEARQKFFDRRSFAMAVAMDASGNSFVISAEIHPIAGFTAQEPGEEGKYDHFLQPLQRVLMNAAKSGLKIDGRFVFSSRVPTAREQVNFIGAGFDMLWLSDDNAARDEDGRAALRQLTDAKILKTVVL